eukprot:1972987-Rhodomonas_salina.1
MDSGRKTVIAEDLGKVSVSEGSSLKGFDVITADRYHTERAAKVVSKGDKKVITREKVALLVHGYTARRS